MVKRQRDDSSSSEHAHKKAMISTKEFNSIMSVDRGDDVPEILVAIKTDDENVTLPPKSFFYLKKSFKEIIEKTPKSERHFGAMFRGNKGRFFSPPQPKKYILISPFEKTELVEKRIFSKITESMPKADKKAMNCRKVKGCYFVGANFSENRVVYLFKVFSTTVPHIKLQDGSAVSVCLVIDSKTKEGKQKNEFGYLVCEHDPEKDIDAIQVNIFSSFCPCPLAIADYFPQAADEFLSLRGEYVERVTNKAPFTLNKNVSTAC